MRPTYTQRRSGSAHGVALESSGAKQPYEVGSRHLAMKRLSHTKCDASETSPCRRNGHAKRTARSPQGPRLDAGVSARESRPPAVVVSSSRPHRPVSHRLVGRAASVACVAGRNDACSQTSSISSASGRRPGGQSKCDGVGRVPQRGRRDRCPKSMPRQRGRPWRPSSAVELPRPGRSSSLNASRSVHTSSSSPGVLVFA